MRVLVTGGSGFIGSHTVVSLINSGHEPIIIDNLSNSAESVVGRIGELTGTVPEFHRADIRDTERVAGIVADGVDACIHFAALKSVGESVAEPLRYYDNNVSGTISLLEVLKEANVNQFIFSSSATVYGEGAELPMREDMPVGVATNPYGWSKIMMERVLIDLQTANPDWSICLLRYFNPVGAHPSGLIGEEPSGIPNNLMPYVAKVAAGELDHVRVFGNDYPTPDGTGVRDYIHVEDLAEGHVRSLEAHRDDAGVHVYNLGTGRGNSVLEVIQAYARESGVEIPFVVEERRPGDVAASYADVQKAYARLGWSTKLDLSDMCRDSWNWVSRRPR